MGNFNINSINNCVMFVYIVGVRYSVFLSYLAETNCKSLSTALNKEKCTCRELFSFSDLKIPFIKKNAEELCQTTNHERVKKRNKQINLAKNIKKQQQKPYFGPLVNDIHIWQILFRLVRLKVCEMFLFRQSKIVCSNKIWPA